jgi:hypothetical protein
MNRDEIGRKGLKLERKVLGPRLKMIKFPNWKSSEVCSHIEANPAGSA